jgi:ribonuclease HII
MVVKQRWWLGVDEAGLGAWAGPATVGGVLVNDQWVPPAGLTDSKKLTAKKRESLLEIMCADSALISHVEWVSQKEIDELNPRAACEKAIRQTIKHLMDKVPVDDHIEIVIDGTYGIDRIGFHKVACEPKADLNYPCVSAASIFAKVVRDNHMVALGWRHPEFHFESHKGYGTKAHRQAIEAHGPILGVHRMSYNPMREMS